MPGWEETVTSGAGALVGRLRAAVDVLYREVLKFGVVGLVAFVVDIGGFNLLTTGLWPGAGGPPLDGHEKLAKVISAGTATVIAYLGNRYWTFRHRRRATPRREFVLFVGMNLVGMLIAVACLTVSHDVLGFTSSLADNISGNLIGIGLGTLFRFWAYRTLVFKDLGLVGGGQVALPVEEDPAAAAAVDGAKDDARRAG